MAVCKKGMRPIMRMRVTNPVERKDYGVWEIKDLAKALSAPMEHPRFNIAMVMLYDLHSDELDFEIINEKQDDENQSQ